MIARFLRHKSQGKLGGLEEPEGSSKRPFDLTGELCGNWVLQTAFQMSFTKPPFQKNKF